MANQDVVRIPLRVREHSRRTLDQQLGIRFPALAVLTSRLLTALPQGSRMRRVMLARSIRLGLEAYNRRDLDAAMILGAPELEYHPYREFVEAGLAEPVYRGPAGYKRYIEATYEVWGADVRIEPTEFIDLGDRFVILADMPMRAQASGINLDQKYASISTLKHGRLVRHQDFLKHEDALRSVGLSA